MVDKCSVVSKKCFLMIYVSDRDLRGNVPGDLVRYYLAEGFLFRGELTEKGADWLKTLTA